jgi:hypothetical protein
MRKALWMRRAGRRSIGLLAVLQVFGFSGRAIGQVPCTSASEELIAFNKGAKLANGSRGTVFASISWDPDGDGPEPAWLVIGGRFDSMNGVAAENLAAWDGERWRSFGADMNGTTQVNALCIHQGRLYAGGSFTSISGEFVGGLIELTPDGWRLPGGVRGPVYTGSISVIRSMLSDGDSLFIGGMQLRTEDGSFPGLVVRWDGETYWGTGLSVGLLSEPGVHSLGFHNGELYAAGQFEGTFGSPIKNIARFDGTSWHAVGSGMDRALYATASFDGAIHITGHRLVDGGPSVWRWDGVAWVGVGDAVNTNPVRAMIVRDGELIIGAQTSSTEHQDRYGVSRLADAAWVPIEHAAFSLPLGSTNFTLSEHEGDLIAGGDRQRAGGARFAGSLARWDGEDWTTVDHSLGASVYAMLADGEDLLVGGAFVAAGGVKSKGIARVTAEGVESLETPIRFVSGSQERVAHLAWWGDRVVATGSLVADGSASMGIVIREPDGAWWAPEHSYEWLDARKSVGIADELYVAASLEIPPETSRLSLLLWRDGAWEEIASASDAFVLSDICEHEGEVVAGGLFSSIGGVSAASIAAYDGAESRPLGEGLTGLIESVTSHRGTIVAAGRDLVINETGEIASLVRWDDTAWRPLSGPVAQSFGYVESTELGLVAGTASRMFVLRGGRWVEVSGLLNGPATSFVARGAATMGGRLSILGATREGGIDFAVPTIVDLPCEADLNCDGEGDILDFLEYLQAFGACDGGEPGCDSIRADFDQNGTIDIMDVMAFMDAFGAGCE